MDRDPNLEDPNRFPQTYGNLVNLMLQRPVMERSPACSIPTPPWRLPYG